MHTLNKQQSQSFNQPMRRIIMNTKITWILLLFSHFAQAYVTYGVGNNCDYNANDHTVQDLIDLNETNIRITNEITFFENLVIDVDELMIRGGYNNCTDAINNIRSQNKTTFDGNDTGPVISIREGSDIPSFITLENLQIKNGKNAGVYQSGGVSIYTPTNLSVHVVIRDSIISLNTSIRGGGVSLNGLNTSLILDATLILNNTAIANAGSAGLGGGLYCSKGYVLLKVNSGISSNQAINNSGSGGHGGGIYATQACRMNIQTGTTGGLLDFRGIAYNSSTGHGGGIYASSSADLLLDTGIYRLPVNVNNNAANVNASDNGNGGGIYLTGNGTTVQATGILLNDNFAINGAGAAVENGALLTMAASGERCWNRKKCNLISHNQAIGTDQISQGGAFFVNDAMVRIQDAHIDHNQADEGVVIFAEDADSTIIERSFIYKNGDFGNLDSPWESKFTYAFLNSNVTILHITSVNNDTSTATIHQTGASHLIYGSIFFEPMTNQTGNFINASGIKDCLMIQNNFGLQGLTNSFLEFPLFVDLAGDDFHLQSQSNAIDRCEPGQITTSAYDIDGESTPYDVQNITYGLGIYDIGADEYHDQIQIEDLIFSNGFE